VVLTTVGQTGFGKEGLLPELLGFPVVVVVELDDVTFWFDSVAQMTTRLPVTTEPAENPADGDVVQLACAVCGCSPKNIRSVAKAM
jgi:hypothetical protein